MQVVIVRVWLLTVAVSMVWTGVAVARHANRAMPIMNFVWPLMTLYFGPLGLWMYLALSGQALGGHPLSQPVMPATPGLTMQHRGRNSAMHETTHTEHAMATRGMAGMHGRSATSPRWQRALRSSTHCAAGCALGDLIAMVLVEGAGVFGGTMLGEVALGSVLAFVLGLFVFQTIPVMAERHVGFRDSLSLALRADAITICAYLVGQLIGLSTLAGRMPMGMGLTAVGFMIMQASMAAGFLTTYPANYALVAAGIKAGM